MTRPASCRALRVATCLLGFGTATGCQPPADSTGAVEGHLRIFFADDLDRGVSWMEQAVETADGRTIVLDSVDPIDLEAGTKVRVSGAWIDASHMKVSAATPTCELRAGSDIGLEQRGLVPTTPPAPRKVGVILFNFTADRSEPQTPDQIRDKVFRGPKSAKAHILENSFGWVTLAGAVSPEGDVFGWYTIANNNASCDHLTWGNAALAKARDAGVDTSVYDHILFIFSKTAACFWGGYGEFGGGTAGPNGVTYGRLAFVNGNGVRDCNCGTGEEGIVSHELGHNFRMSHSSSYACRNSVGQGVSLGGDCTTSDYGNGFDVMGNGGLKHSTGYGKGRAGWIGSANMRTVRKAGTYTIQPIEKAIACGTQTLRIARTGTGANTQYYYVDFRQPIGFDNYDPGSPAVTGVLIYLALGHEAAYQASLLIDTRPETPTFADAPLGVGLTYKDPNGVVNITNVSTSGGMATVTIEFPRGDTGTNTGGCPSGEPIPTPDPDGGIPGDASGADAGSSPETVDGAYDANPDVAGGGAGGQGGSAGIGGGGGSGGIGGSGGSAARDGGAPPANGNTVTSGGCGCRAPAPHEAPHLPLVLGAMGAISLCRARAKSR